MSSISRLVIILVVFISYSTYSQNEFSTLGESALSINHKVSKSYNVSFTARSRYIVYQNPEFIYIQQQVDIYHFSTYKLSSNKDMSLGVYYRNRDLFDFNQNNEFRITQQFNVVKQKTGMRYGQRFRSEQRFLTARTSFRQRYCIYIDFPLTRKQSGVNKTYFITALEGLLSLSKGIAPELDKRTTAKIGVLLSEKLKLEAGLEYRLEAFNQNAEHNLFVLSSAILKI